MNGRANDGERTVHAAIELGGALYTRCIVPGRGASREQPRMYLSVRTRAPVTCKHCLRIILTEGI